MPTQPKKKPNPRTKAKSKAVAPRGVARSKLDQITRALKTRNGVTLADLTNLTGWQPHSVRGALAGALKKRGLIIRAELVGNERRYRIASAT